jgi:hypothetical protein
LKSTSVNNSSLQEALGRGDHISKRKDCPLDKDELGKDIVLNALRHDAGMADPERAFTAKHWWVNIGKQVSTTTKTRFRVNSTWAIARQQLA